MSDVQGGIDVLRIWIDPKTGKRIKILGNRYRMKYKKVAAHAAIRAFVHKRDNFTCRTCGISANPPADYDGREALLATDNLTIMVVDHILSLRRGGTNHPSNLQTLCDSCNARKSCLIEGAGGVYA